jgi:hypothetical protein
MLVNNDWQQDTYNFYGGSRIGAKSINDSNGLPGYIAWVLDAHNYSNIYITSSNSSVMSCSGMSCTANSPGIVTLTAHIPDYVARMRSWIKFNSPTTGSFPNGLGGLYLSSYGTSWLHSGSCTAYSARSGSYLKGVKIDGGNLTWTVTVLPVVQPTCGTAAKNYDADAAGYSGSYCGIGTHGAIQPFPSPGGSSSWTCTNGAGSIICAATVSADLNGECNPVLNGRLLPTKPTALLCTRGTASSVTGGTDPTTDPWVWTCSGIGNGTTDSCTAYPPAPLTVNIIPSDSSPNITDTVTFTAHASGGVPPYTSYVWGGADISETTTVNLITHRFNSLGTKNLNVVVTDSNSNTAAGNTTITVVDDRELQ